MLTYLTNRLTDLQTQAEKEPSAIVRISFLLRISEVIRQIKALIEYAPAPAVDR